jgi:outer membrane protein assembly factor BamB
LAQATEESTTSNDRAGENVRPQRGDDQRGDNERRGRGRGRVRGGRRGGRGGGGGYGSVVDAGSALLVLTPAMELVVYEPSTTEFKELARYKVAETPTYAYPVLSGRRIYVKDQDNLVLWSVE